MIYFGTTSLLPTPRLTGTGKSNTKSAVAKHKHQHRHADSLNALPKTFFAWPGWKWFGGAGWLLAAVLACWAAPRIYHHLIIARPAAQRENWNQTLAEKKRALAAPWQDARPLIILAGDSHIEFGDWYDLLGGASAVRNCGLARAKIADITQLVLAIGDHRPKMVVLMCGINNLGAGGNPATCLGDYEALLATVRSHLQPETILVLSVMPVRTSAVDRASRQLNAAVNQFNSSLAACCRREQVEFLDVNSAVTGANGGLAAALTVDGLHLNAQGYRRLAGIIAPQLAPPTHAP